MFAVSLRDGWLLLIFVREAGCKIKTCVEYHFSTSCWILAHIKDNRFNAMQPSNQTWRAGPRIRHWFTDQQWPWVVSCMHHQFPNRHVQRVTSRTLLDKSPWCSQDQSKRSQLANAYVGIEISIDIVKLHSTFRILLSQRYNWFDRIMTCHQISPCKLKGFGD